jgi:hypothetical protein
MRKLDGTEPSAKKERADIVTERKDELEALGESWERIGNRHLERRGLGQIQTIRVRSGSSSPNTGT